MGFMGAYVHLEESLKNRAWPRTPPLTTAQRSNTLALTAAGYHAWRTHSLSLLTGQPFSLEREAQLFLGLCRPVAGQRWLDVGTSTGFYAEVLARAGCGVLACDLSDPMLQAAHARLRRDRAAGHLAPEVLGQITWAQLNMEAGGLPDADFDGVTVGATLNETHDPLRLLAECERVLRPGGTLWLMYILASGGPLQRLLGMGPAGGLSFPDPAEVARALPGCQRVDALSVGTLALERFVKRPA